MNSLFCIRPWHRSPISFMVGAVLAASLPADAAAARARQVSARSLAQGFVTEALAVTEFRPAERAFLGKAVETARQQMRLAEIGVSQATNADVRSHAQQLVSDYRSMHDAFAALIRRRGGIAGAPVGGTSETYQKLVEKAGPNFDREFVRTVAGITDDLLTLFEQVTSESKDADVRELAAAQLPVLRAHRSEITGLQKTFD